MTAMRRCERFVENPRWFFALDLVRHPGWATPYQAGGGSGGFFGSYTGSGIEATAAGVFLDLGQPGIFLPQFHSGGFSQ